MLYKQSFFCKDPSTIVVIIIPFILFPDFKGRYRNLFSNIKLAATINKMFIIGNSNLGILLFIYK